MARRPLTPFVYLALAIASLSAPVSFLLYNPRNAFALLPVVPGAGLAFIFLYIFANTFYFEGGSKPSFFERVRVRKCPYCGAWAVHAVEKELQDVETGGTAMVGSSYTADGVFGTKSSGMDAPTAPATVAVTTLKFQESFQCNKCGKTWTRTVTHEETPPEAFGKYSAQLQEQGYQD